LVRAFNLAQRYQNARSNVGTQNMIARTLKLKPNKQQEAKLNTWLLHLTSVHNWAIKKIENDARDHIYYTPNGFHNLLANHSKTLEIPSHVIKGILTQAYTAWQRCFKKLSNKPRLKGRRNKLNSIPFPDSINAPNDNRVSLPGLRRIKFHKQTLPNSQIKAGRIIRRESGWYLCLSIDAEPNSITAIAAGTVGIDPGFRALLTLSTGEKVDHPKELQLKLGRLAQAQRGRRKRLAARLHERVANQRRDRNHKLSRRLVSENQLIAFSKDNLNGLSKKFGKSVASSAIGQLRQMLSYKSQFCGREYVEVDSRNSTMTCSNCSARSGPTGLRRLAVRQWECDACGAYHDRDINAAINTLIAGAGTAHERSRHRASPNRNSALRECPTLNEYCND
jgi:putative transposase